MSPTWNRILIGDAVGRLRELPANSIDTCITSPPYFQLRDYGVTGQIGMEAAVDEWVEHLRQVLSEVARVLRPTGSVWLNVGDSFARRKSHGALPKSLLLGPERLALALQADGWIVRNRVAWVKSNPMPGSVRDRLNCSWETIYLLVRSPHYYFDLDAIRVPHRTPGRRSAAAAARAAQPRGVPAWAGPLAGSQNGLDRIKASGRQGHVLGKNPGDVITTASSNYRGAHFATFPPALVRPLLRATCPAQTCAACGQPWHREQARRVGHLAVLGELLPSCSCQGTRQPGIVLDPFFGAGTVGLVAQEHGRRWIGVELNPAFAQLAEERIAAARGGPASRAA